MFKQVVTFALWAIVAILSISQANAFHEGGDGGGSTPSRSETQNSNLYDMWVFCVAEPIVALSCASTGSVYSGIFRGDKSNDDAYTKNFVGYVREQRYFGARCAFDVACEYRSTQGEAKKALSDDWRARPEIFEGDKTLTDIEPHPYYVQ